MVVPGGFVMWFWEQVLKRQDYSESCHCRDCADVRDEWFRALAALTEAP